MDQDKSLVRCVVVIIYVLPFLFRAYKWKLYASISRAANFKRTSCLDIQRNPVLQTTGLCSYSLKKLFMTKLENPHTHKISLKKFSIHYTD